MLKRIINNQTTCRSIYKNLLTCSPHETIPLDPDPSLQNDCQLSPYFTCETIEKP